MYFYMKFTFSFFLLFFFYIMLILFFHFFETIFEEFWYELEFFDEYRERILEEINGN